MTNLQLIRELAGNQCRCGGFKTARQTFCKGCYYSLPMRARQALYNRVGDGYREAYNTAVMLLENRKEWRETV